MGNRHGLWTGEGHQQSDAEGWRLRRAASMFRLVLTLLLGLGVLGGYAPAVADGAYPAPTISGVSPTSGPASGGTVITISGANFRPGARVTIGSNAATNVDVVSATTITATTPAGIIGINQVWVQNVDGQNGYLAPSSQCVGCGFYYQEPPGYPITLFGRVLNGNTLVPGVGFSSVCNGAPPCLLQPSLTASDGTFTMYATPALVAISVYNTPSGPGVNSTQGFVIDTSQGNVFGALKVPVASSTVQLSGTVTDACTGAPIDDAGIYLTVSDAGGPPSAGSLAGLAFTDSDGRYAVAVAPGTYGVGVNANPRPYGTDGIGSVTFPSSGAISQNFRLRPNAGCSASGGGSSSSGGSSGGGSSSGGSGSPSGVGTEAPPAPSGAMPLSGSGSIPAAGGSFTSGNMALTAPGGDLGGDANVTVVANPSLPFPGGGAVLYSPNGTVLDIAITDATTGKPITVFPEPLTLTFQLTPADLAMAAGASAGLTLLFQVDADTPPGENPDHLPVGSFVVLPAGPCSVDPVTERMTCRLNFLGSKLAVASPRTAYVQNFAPDAPLWSGPDAKAVRLNSAPQFTTFLVAEPQVGGRILVFDYRTSDYAWIDATNVGPSGPPKAR